MKSVEKKMKAKDDENSKLKNKCELLVKHYKTSMAEHKDAQAEAKTATDALATYKAGGAKIMAEKKEAQAETKGAIDALAKYKVEAANSTAKAREVFEAQLAQARTTLEHEMEIRKSMLLAEKANTNKARHSLGLETANLAAKESELDAAQKKNESLETSVVKLQDRFVAAMLGYFSINLIYFIVRDADSVISISLHFIVRDAD